MSNSAESHAHEQFRELAQKIFNESGLVVNSVSFDWMELTEFGAKKRKLLASKSSIEASLAASDVVSSASPEGPA